MQLLGYPALFTYVGFGISASFLLVRLGHSVLDLLRDFDDYRAKRSGGLTARIAQNRPEEDRAPED